MDREDRARRIAGDKNLIKNIHESLSDAIDMLDQLKQDFDQLDIHSADIEPYIINKLEMINDLDDVDSYDLNLAQLIERIEEFNDSTMDMNEGFNSTEYVKNYILEFPNSGNPIKFNLDLRNGKLIAGDMIDGEIKPEFEIDFDEDFDADWNINVLYNLIVKEHPEYIKLNDIEEAIKTRKNIRLKEDLDKKQTWRTIVSTQDKQISDPTDASEEQNPVYADAMRQFKKTSKIRNNKIDADLKNATNKDFDMNKMQKFTLDESLFD